MGFLCTYIHTHLTEKSRGERTASCGAREPGCYMLQQGTCHCIICVQGGRETGQEASVENIEIPSPKAVSGGNNVKRSSDF